MLQISTRKDQIYSIAEQLFSRQGYHATTVRAIARELQIEGGSLYSHISRKQDLLYEIVLRASAQFLRAAREVAASGGPAREQLRALMARHLAIIAESTARASVYFHEWRHLDPEQRSVVLRHRDEYEGYLRSIIRAGIAGGEFAPLDERLAGLQILSLLNWSYQWYKPDGQLAAGELAERFFEIAMVGLAPRDSGSQTFPADQGYRARSG